MPALDRNLEIPDAVREIAQRLEDAGYETWAVGGAVRDALLGHRRADWDLATAARPEVVRKLFRPSYPIGIQFGTVGVRGSDDRVYEVTTFRRDMETDGRHAVVAYSDQLDEDLARRDFTINAIAYHPFRRTLHDPFDGLDDLRNRVLRAVGDPAERFAEDYLRMLRGLRFAGRYDLRIDPATWEALQEAAVQLPKLSGERLREEILKVLSGPGAERGLALYRESGALEHLLPELARLDADRWEQVVRSVASIARNRAALRLVQLLRPAAEDVESIAERLRLSNAESRACLELHRGAALPLPEPGDAAGARRWLNEVGRERARDVIRLKIADARGRSADPAQRRALADRARLVLRVLRRGDPVELADLAIDGNDLKELGLQPGPEYAEILQACLEAVMQDPDLNTRQRLREHVREHHMP